MIIMLMQAVKVTTDVSRRRTNEGDAWSSMFELPDRSKVQRLNH